MGNSIDPTLKFATILLMSSENLNSVPEKIFCGTCPDIPKYFNTFFQGRIEPEPGGGRRVGSGRILRPEKEEAPPHRGARQVKIKKYRFCF